VSFHNVHLRYRSQLPYALNGVSFDIRPGEKIGIVGRTGAGKSSLFLALLRLVEIEAGSIVVDGINIQHVSLARLRYVATDLCITVCAVAQHCCKGDERFQWEMPFLRVFQLRNP